MSRHPAPRQHPFPLHLHLDTRFPISTPRHSCLIPHSPTPTPRHPSSDTHAPEPHAPSSHHNTKKKKKKKRILSENKLWRRISQTINMGAIVSPPEAVVAKCHPGLATFLITKIISALQIYTGFMCFTEMLMAGSKDHRQPTLTSWNKVGGLSRTAS